MTYGRSESTFGQKKASKKEVTCFECKEFRHYKNECPKLKRDKKPKKAYKAKKGLMETWDDSEFEDKDFEEEHANIALMAKTSTSKVASEDTLTLDYESDSDDEQEVLSSLSRSELEIGLSELMKRYKLLLSKHKILKKEFCSYF